MKDHVIFPQITPQNQKKRDIYKTSTFCVYCEPLLRKHPSWYRNVSESFRSDLEIFINIKSKCKLLRIKNLIIYQLL